MATASWERSGSRVVRSWSFMPGHMSARTQARQQDELAEEDRGAQDPLDQPEEEAVAELVLDEAGQADGHHEEQPDREDEGDDDRARPHALADLLLVVLELRVGRDAQRPEADL